MVRYLRPSVNGGISECRSPDEKVGYGRCHHVPGSDQQTTINYNRGDKCHYVEVSGGNSESNLNKNKVEIKRFIDKVNSYGFSEDKAREIINRIS